MRGSSVPPLTSSSAPGVFLPAPKDETARAPPPPPLPPHPPPPRRRRAGAVVEEREEAGMLRARATHLGPPNGRRQRRLNVESNRRAADSRRHTERQLRVES